MTDKEIIQEVLNQIRLLREEIAQASNQTLSTVEACSFLKLKDARYLNYFNAKGFLPRYGGMKTGYKYSRKHLEALQTKLLSGEVYLPKSLAANGRKENV